MSFNFKVNIDTSYFKKVEDTSLASQIISSSFDYNQSYSPPSKEYLETLLEIGIKAYKEKIEKNYLPNQKKKRW